MPRHVDDILANALELPPLERAELVESLLSSFEFPFRGTIDSSWAQEAEDRVEAFERGEMAAIPARDVFTEIENSSRR